MLEVMSKANEALVKWQDTFWTVITVAVRPQIQRELHKTAISPEVAESCKGRIRECRDEVNKWGLSKVREVRNYKGSSG